MGALITAVNAAKTRRRLPQGTEQAAGPPRGALAASKHRGTVLGDPTSVRLCSTRPNLFPDLVIDRHRPVLVGVIGEVAAQGGVVAKDLVLNGWPARPYGVKKVGDVFGDVAIAGRGREDLCLLLDRGFPGLGEGV